MKRAITGIGFTVLLLLKVCLCITPASAQFSFQKISSFIRPKPDKLFANRQYYAAAQAFEKEIAEGNAANTADIQRKIGLCYLRINQPQKALSWLQRAIDYGIADADTWYNYGLALQQTASYSAAIAAFENCSLMQPGHPTVMIKIESCRFAMMNNHVNPHVQFRPATEVNTVGGEFGTSLYAGDIVYYASAAAPVDENAAAVDRRTGLQHVTTYMARMHGNKFVYVQAADNTLPKYITDELFAYDSIANAVYFAYCNPSDSRCGIYTSRFELEKWTDPEIIIQNRKDQVNGHPAIANGGNRLYFTSNSSGGTGQTDIWYMDRMDDGKWGTSVNAGNIVNSYGRDEFPFVYADTLLFFASDGHVGYGGLDIFCSVIKGNTFSPPVNLLRPFNSSGDDFSLTVSNNTGILSSARNETMSDDIYFFEGLPSFRYLSGYVTEYVTGEPLANTRLTLLIDGTGEQQIISDSTGYYGFFLRNNQSPMINARTVGYKPSLTYVPPTGGEQFANFSHNIQLQQSTVLPASIYLYDKITGNPVSERSIICYNNDGERQILRTDAAGTFKLLAQEGQREYWIQFPDGTYLTESIILNEEQKTYSFALQPVNSDLFTGWLLFKRGSVEVTEMSQALIPHIAAVIRANPGMVFQIEGFRDAGFEARQQNLAIQRAEYIVKRLMDYDVDKLQLDAVTGIEETDTAEETGNINRRRVEIKIKK